jgi:alpha,alpha-trehalase
MGEGQMLSRRAGLLVSRVNEDGAQNSWPNVWRLYYGATFRKIFCAVVLLRVLSSTGSGQSAPDHSSQGPKLQEILAYIQTGWDSLTRSTNACNAVVDPKFSTQPVVYIPANFPVPKELEQMQRECHVTVTRLPTVIHKLGNKDVESIDPPGLLYLKNKYVVPGGRFNELYGWDSYFIIRGLLREGKVALARGIVDDFFFEIENYGALLNANRTYYLTRSDPPFLSSMVMAVHEAQKAAGQDDRDWLETAYAYVKRDHDMWVSPPHLAGDTGLSRYYDFGEGPAPEALKDENDIYKQVADYFVLHPGTVEYEVLGDGRSEEKLLGSPYSVRVCDAQNADSSCGSVHQIKLNADYYKGDRSMRESGFDVSFRFGPYGAETHHYAAVCLNSLLYKAEADLGEMARLLDKKADADNWRGLAENRRIAIDKYLWDESRGMFFDFNFEDGRRSNYVYASTFYPLWTGVATPEQARAVMKNLSTLEKPGGIAMSVEKSEGQWDYPFGWAPIQLLAVEGMRRYGFDKDANRVSVEFLSMVLENFAHDKTIREKYNVVTRSLETDVKAGYAANVIGFGWTNGTFLELLHELPATEINAITSGIDRTVN